MLQAAQVALSTLSLREGAAEAAQKPEVPFGAVVKQAFARSRAKGVPKSADLGTDDLKQAALCAGAWAAGVSVQKPETEPKEAGERGGVATVPASETANASAPGTVPALTDEALQNAAIPGKAIVTGKTSGAAKPRTAKTGSGEKPGEASDRGAETAALMVSGIALTAANVSRLQDSQLESAVVDGLQGRGVTSTGTANLDGTARVGMPLLGTAAGLTAARPGSNAALSGFGSAADAASNSGAEAQSFATGSVSGGDSGASTLSSAARNSVEAIILSGAAKGSDAALAAAATGLDALTETRKSAGTKTSVGSDAAVTPGAGVSDAAIGSDAASISAVGQRGMRMKPDPAVSALRNLAASGSESVSEKPGETFAQPQAGAFPMGVTEFLSGAGRFPAQQTAAGVENMATSESGGISAANALAESVAMPRLIQEIKSGLRQSPQTMPQVDQGAIDGRSAVAAAASDPGAQVNETRQSGAGAEIGRMPGQAAGAAGTASATSAASEAAGFGGGARLAEPSADRTQRFEPGEPQGGGVAQGGAVTAEKPTVVPLSDGTRAVEGAGSAAEAKTSGKPPGGVKGRSEAVRPTDGRSAAEPGGAVVPEGGIQPVSNPDRAEASARTSAANASPDPDASRQLVRSAIHALQRGETRYHLKLNPENLGEVAVTISARDRELHLTIHAASEATRDLIENQAGGLRSGLADSGYHLSGFSVDVSANGRGGEAFSAFQQGADGQAPGRQPDAKPDGGPAYRLAARAQPERVLETRAGAINLRI